MQQDLAANYPELDILILGVNGYGQEFGNDSISQEGDIPWLQDVDLNGDSRSDVWISKWRVADREVVILDGSNEKVGSYSLAEFDLAISENYNTLRQMLIDAAS